MKGFLSAFFIFLLWASAGIYYVHIKDVGGTTSTTNISENKTSLVSDQNPTNNTAVNKSVVDNTLSEELNKESVVYNTQAIQQIDSLLLEKSNQTNSQLLADEIKKSIAISDTIDINKDEPIVSFKEDITLPSGPSVSSNTFYPSYNNSDLILDEDLVSYADKLKKILKENPEKKVTIIGHTDNVGDAQDNFRIGLKKSRQIKWYLTARRGIPRKKITATSRGEEEPLESNKSKWGRKKNNRIEIIVD